MALQNENLKRRSFLIAGAAAVGSTALSYARIIGANDRISLGHIGVGNRGRELASIVAGVENGRRDEIEAGCDLWRITREHASAKAAQVYGRAPRSFQYMEELLNLNDVDAVIVSTADF